MDGRPPVDFLIKLSYSLSGWWVRKVLKDMLKNKSKGKVLEGNPLGNALKEEYPRKFLKGKSPRKFLEGKSWSKILKEHT